MTSTRFVCFAGTAVSVHSGDEDSAAIVDYLYRHLAPASPRTARVALSLARDADAGDFALRRDDELLYRGPCRGTAALMLLEQSLHHLVDGGCGGLLFHAACVARGDRAVLLPGATGAGKTTLAAWLASRSFDYITDELISLPDGSPCVEGFRRPLNVKAHGRAALAALLDFDDAEHVIATGEGFLVSPAVFGPGQAARPREAALIVFPRYRAGARLEIESLTPARASMLLMSTLVNARALPGHGVPQVAAVARSVPAYSLVLGGFDDIDERIAALLGQAGAPRR